MPPSVSDLEKLRIDRGSDAPKAGGDRAGRPAGASSGSRLASDNLLWSK